MIEKDIENKKTYLYKMFTNNIMDSNIQYTTAMSTMLATKSYNQEVNYLYMNYQIIINKLLNTIINYYGISTSYSLTFPEINFDVETVDTQLQNSLGM